MKKEFIWLSYDLGVRGDYEGMYAWLDTHKAKECGDSMACFWFQFNSTLIEELKEEILKSVSMSKKSRIYVVYKGANGKASGRFIFGARTAAPWDGYAGNDDTSAPDEA